MNSGSIQVTDKCVSLPKIGEIKAIIHREIPKDAVVGSATVSREPDGSSYPFSIRSPSKCLRQ
ncbi:MAG TPA: hypothetical protein DEP00_00365 [Lachnospiraceae bacterium]|nr:hypothetical protein [Lachnospiraceae bacterium]